MQGMYTDFLVIKRDGRQEPIDLEKIHRVIAWAATGLREVSISQVELQARIQFYNRIATQVIHEMLIKAAADLISEAAPDYQYMAARLAVFSLRKGAYGVFEPPHLLDHVTTLVRSGRYDPALLELYSKEEFDEMNQYLKAHERDFNFAYAAIKQMEGKYLVQDRTRGKIFETPQFLYILVAALLFSARPREIRMAEVKQFYDAISSFKLSLPTPIMAGVRTPMRQYSSCVLIECGDSLDSINATASAIVKYASQRAGIGVNAGRIRAMGSAVRGGEVFHTGCIPFYKYFQAAVKSCSQGGVRGGAATLFFPLWHLEVESLLVLKNNRGVEDNRARHLDYGVQLNRLMYQRLQLGGEITLFSPSDVPDLYEAFFEDNSKFETLYQTYEAQAPLRKKRVKAADLFSLLAQERASTGRIYIQHVDHCNTHSAFDPAQAPIRQSNLCMEVTLPTQPLPYPYSDGGEIALCTLSAFNLGAIQSLDELLPLARLIVRALDALLDFQHYPLKAAQVAALGRRSLGIGVINFAYYLAKSGKKYSDGSAKGLTHRTFEAIQYALLQASCELAAQLGPCRLFHQTRYSQGFLPIDTYKRQVDDICSEPLHLDWEGLRAQIKQYGLRNSTLSCLMPSETSSQIANATNGIEPPRGHVSIKASKEGLLKQIVPEYERLRGQYELLWSMKNNLGYLELVGIMQKFVDQSISVNLNYDPKRFTGQKVPLKEILKDLLLSYRLGIKTLYYHNTRDGMEDPNLLLSKRSPSSSISDPDTTCEGGGCIL